jgi:hypothetical protein
VEPIFQSELLEPSVDDEGRYAWISRTSLPAASGPSDELDDLARAVGSLRASRMRLIIDLRRAPGRNDTDFESRIVAAFHRIIAAFPHRAFLVATQAGKLQIRGVVGGDVEVFVDEADARRFAVTPS